jgi:hypothetical protein
VQEPPPAYYMPPAPRRSSSRIWWIIGGIVLFFCCACGILALIFVPRFIKNAAAFAGCMESMSLLHLAIERYASDHNGKLPAADKWQEELAPYYEKLRGSRTTGLDELPQNQPWGCTDAEGKVVTGIAFNDNLSGKEVSKVEDVPQTPVLFEIERPSMNANEPYRFREYESSPEFFFGFRRGWMELDTAGQLYLLVRKDNGRYARMPLERGRSGRGLDIDKDKAFDAKVPENPAK